MPRPELTVERSLLVVVAATFIATAACVWAIVDGLGFRPLGLGDEKHLFRLMTADVQGSSYDFSYVNLVDAENHLHEFADVAAYTLRGAAIATQPGGEARLDLIAVVSPSFSRTLGTASEAATDVNNVRVAISSEFAQSRLGDGNPLGRIVYVNRVPCLVTQVVPPGIATFDPEVRPALWFPVSAWRSLVGPGGIDEPRDSNARSFRMVGRLRSDADAAGLRDALTTLGRTMSNRIAAAGPPPKLVAEFGALGRMGRLRAVGLAFAALGTIVVLAALANLWSLLAAYRQRRFQEFSIRMALGASRARLLADGARAGLGITSIAALLGLGTVYTVISALPTLLPPSPLPLGLGFAVDRRVLTTAGVAALGVLFIVTASFGLHRRASDSTALTFAHRGSVGRGGNRGPLRDALVLVQVTLSIVLVAATLQLWLALSRAAEVDVGFHRDSVILLSPAPSTAGYSNQQVEHYYDELIRAVGALKGANTVALADHVPLSPFGGGGMVRLRRESGTEQVAFTTADQGFVRALGLRVHEGRWFAATDTSTGPAVVVINAEMEKRLNRSGTIVGQSLDIEGPDGRFGAYEIVGVIGTVKRTSPFESPRAQVYFPRAQRPVRNLTVIIATAPESAALVASAAQLTTRSLDPTVPVLRVQTLAEQVDLSLYPVRLLRTVAGAIAAVGIILSISGLFAMTAYRVRSTRREAAIRSALGAAPKRIAAYFAKRAMWVLCISIVAGGTLAMLTSALIRATFPGSPNGTPATVAASAVVALAAAIAIMVPVREAWNLEMSQTLRAE